jgi:hypothetical protein
VHALKGDHVDPSAVNRGHPGSKHHLIVDGHGIPLAATLTGGNSKVWTQHGTLEWPWSARWPAKARRRPGLAQALILGQAPVTTT